MSHTDESISGVVERITFHNLDNGYVVLRVVAPKHRDVVTVVGTLTNVVAGEYIEARGQWVNDKTHGVQFKADELKTTPPHTAAGIAKYLGSGLIKGIGPTLRQAHRRDLWRQDPGSHRQVPHVFIRG